MGEIFINLYDDGVVDIIVPARHIEKIERGPKSVGNITCDQWIKVYWIDKGTETYLKYRDEENADDAFEHFCEQLGIE